MHIGTSKPATALSPAVSAEALLEGVRMQMTIGSVNGPSVRAWVDGVAREVGVTGRVSHAAGEVSIDAFGTPALLQAFQNRLARTVPSGTTITQLRTEPIPYEAVRLFQAIGAAAAGSGCLSIPPDVPTCPDCLRELRDSKDRRFAYPFINCATCGPRFTIATAAPYARANTTMSGFAMCPACQREYDTAEDRRFHAEPNGCHVCGPTLRVVASDGGPVLARDPIGFAAEAIERGQTVAIKGTGGFHLACDATSPAAVATLRARKRGDEKPFTVMVRDLATARRIGTLGDAEARLLASQERPIVLLSRRDSAPIADAVAPRHALVGVMLPYSPLHHLLLDRVQRPLVMTSGTIGDEPIAYTDEEALARLAAVADFFVLHNREIVTRCDDSVARVIAGTPAVLRRSRGYVPRPIQLARTIDRPVLACGGLRKNTFCLARGGEAWLGPHVGDLESLDTYRAYCESIARFQRFLQFEPVVVAHDLHPDYLSTTYARARRGAVTIGVQHHHAHVASVMAEHALDGKVIGIAYDGGGHGTDGTSWGGEILIAGYGSFERAGTFRPIALPGGDLAITQPWRTALALVDDAFGGEAPIEALAVFAQVQPDELRAALQAIRDGGVPLAHAIGRYFDAMGALGLNRATSAYEGQLAFDWNLAADPTTRGRYRYDIDCSPPCSTVDLRPAIRDAVFEIIGGEAPPRISGRFHNTLAAATVDLVRCVERTSGRLPVVLSGGCFQNRRLTESILTGLGPDFATYVHRTVPPGDGGLSLGQAVIADALAKER